MPGRMCNIVRQKWGHANLGGTVNEIILEVRVPFFDWSWFVGRKKWIGSNICILTWKILSPISLTDFTVTVNCSVSLYFKDVQKRFKSVLDCDKWQNRFC